MTRQRKAKPGPGDRPRKGGSYMRDPKSRKLTRVKKTAPVEPFAPAPATEATVPAPEQKEA